MDKKTKDLAKEEASEDEGLAAASLREKIQTDYLWFASAALISVLAAFLRFFSLELKPLHHDEGVNGHFLTALFRTGEYHYDPSNYHGPDLYYLSLAFSKVFGLNTFSVRSSVAIFGFLTVVLALYFRKYIGKTGSLAAALMLALSPGMVFISRYFIHEILFIFLSLAIVLAVVLFFDRQKAGTGALIWMTLLMMLCFIPVSVMGISAFAGKNSSLIWGLGIAVLLVESVLIFFVMRMLIKWNGGRPVYLILASASAVLLYATKETAFITHGTMLIAVACVAAWFWLFSKAGVYSIRTKLVWSATGIAVLGGVVFSAVYSETLREFSRWFYGQFTPPLGPEQSWLFFIIALMGIVAAIAYFVFVLDTENGPAAEKPSYTFDENEWKNVDWILTSAAAAFVFSFLLVLFFTSFFKYPGDFSNFFSAYAFWAKTSSSDHTQSGYIGYVKWMLHLEAPLVFLSILGTLIAVIKTKSRFALFAGLWAFGLFLAYSIISYKTPWLALSFTLPMCLVGGYAINELISSKDRLQLFAGIVLAVMGTVVLTFQTYDLNFVRYDDESMPYVYAHTTRGFEDLMKEVKRVAAESSQKDDAAIEVVTDEYWPMPWYLNEYPNARFHGKLVNVTTSEMIIAKSGQLPDLPELYSRHFKFVGEWPLRPGVDLYLLVRNDLAGPNSKTIYEIEP